MKYLFILLLFPWFASAQIPNAGFENWSMRNGTLQPDGWETNNFIRPSPPYDTLQFVKQDTSSFTGQYAVYITNDVPAGFEPISGYISCYFKPVNRIDTLSVFIKIPDRVPVGGGLNINLSDFQNNQYLNFSITDTLIPNYTEWKIPYTFNTLPDSLKITIGVGCSCMQYIPGVFLDDISFNGNFSSNLSEKINHPISLYPNPVNDLLVINTELNIVQAFITDLHGKTLHQNHSFQKEISMSIFPKGVYILHLIGPDVNISKKIIKE